MEANAKFFFRTGENEGFVDALVDTDTGIVSVKGQKYPIIMTPEYEVLGLPGIKGVIRIDVLDKCKSNRSP